MNKITCEICGTAFAGTSACCPICGWAPDGNSQNAGMDFEELDLGQMQQEPAPRSNGRRIFDFDEANGSPAVSEQTEEDDTAYYGVDTNPEEPHRTNTGLVVALVVFIVLVLLATGVLVVKFLLPAKEDSGKKETTLPTIVAETLPDTQPENTEAETIPCTALFAPTVKTLTQEGQLWRLNVQITPEDTTDEITYVSENEEVVTVTPEGNLVAVADGSTNVVISCGSQTIKCPVTVAIEQEPETTEQTEAATEETEPEETKGNNTTLKLKKTDITFSRLGVYTTLQLDCDLTAEEVTWRTSNSAIVNVNNGVVTAMGPGVAKITVTYGDQQVSCIVRCKF